MNDRPLRVLIVDDNEDSARMLKLLLEIEGHEVNIAFNAADALATAGELPPDVSLLDLTLPDMNGLELAEEMRRRAELDDCVLVSVSGYGAERLPSPSPFHTHFVKPLEHDALASLLKEIQAGKAGG